MIPTEQYVNELNLNSSKQVSKLLYKELNYECSEKTEKGDPSVGEKALKELAKKSKISRMLLTYRELNKLLSTYTLEGETKIKKGLKNDVLHGEFNQAGTKTGRFSSKNPNLQNIPSKDKFGIRSIFKARKGHSFIVADYSQMEPRILAHLSNDIKLINDFLQDKDIYSELSKEFGISRDVAKTFFLAMNYGASKWKISYVTGKSEEIASAYIKKFDKLHSGIKILRDGVKRQLEIGNEVRTLWGRRRRFKDFNSLERKQRQGCIREAFNFLMQGTSADIVKLALVRTKEYKPILTVHDEIVYEVQDDKVQEISKEIKKQMQNFNLCVPLPVEVKICKRWSEGK